MHFSDQRGVLHVDQLVEGDILQGMRRVRVSQGLKLLFWGKEYCTCSALSSALHILKSRLRVRTKEAFWMETVERTRDGRGTQWQSLFPLRVIISNRIT